MEEGVSFCEGIFYGIKEHHLGEFCGMCSKRERNA